jgi:hypothetical protein
MILRRICQQVLVCRLRIRNNRQSPAKAFRNSNQPCHTHQLRSTHIFHRRIQARLRLFLRNQLLKPLPISRRKIQLEVLLTLTSELASVMLER